MTEATAMPSDEQERRRCAGTTAAGQPCGVGPELVLPNGYCFTHDPRPGAAEKLRAAGLLGGLTTGKRMRKGIEVGELVTPEDARRITALVATAVASGALPAAQGRTVLVAITAWLRAHEAAEDDLVERLQAEIARLKGAR